MGYNESRLCRVNRAINKQFMNMNVENKVYFYVYEVEYN